MMSTFSTSRMLILSSILYVLSLSSAAAANLVPIETSNIRMAVQEWYTNSEQAITKYGPIESWDTSHVTDLSQVFYNIHNVEELIDLSQWDTSNVLYMSTTFASSSNLKLNVSTWDLQKLTFMAGMFYDSSHIDIDVSQWNISKVTDMDRMFTGASNLHFDVSKWDTSNVKDMYAMFHVASNLELDGIEDWNTTSVVNMNAMFESSYELDFDLSNWDTSSVTDMYTMFQNAYWMDDVLCWNLNSHDGVNLQSIFCGTSQGGFDCNCISPNLLASSNLRCDDTLPKCVERKVITRPTNNDCIQRNLNCNEDEFDTNHYNSGHDLEAYNTPITSSGARNKMNVLVVEGVQSSFWILVTPMLVGLVTFATFFIL